MSESLGKLIVLSIRMRIISVVSFNGLETLGALPLQEMRMTNVDIIRLYDNSRMVIYRIAQLLLVFH